MQGRCFFFSFFFFFGGGGGGGAWFSEFSGVVLRCFTASSSTIFMDVSLIKPEASFNPFFNAVLCSYMGQETFECQRYFDILVAQYQRNA